MATQRETLGQLTASSGPTSVVVTVAHEVPPSWVITTTPCLVSVGAGCMYSPTATHSTLEGQETDSRVDTPGGMDGLAHALPPSWLTAKDIADTKPTAAQVDETQLTSPKPPEA